MASDLVDPAQPGAGTPTLNALQPAWPAAGPGHKGAGGPAQIDLFGAPFLVTVAVRPCAQIGGSGALRAMPAIHIPRRWPSTACETENRLANLLAPAALRPEPTVRLSAEPAQWPADIGMVTWWNELLARPRAVTGLLSQMPIASLRK